MSEYRFAHAPLVSRGRAMFRVHNTGNLDHQLILVDLPDDLPGSFDEQLRSATRRVVLTVTTLPQMKPEERTIFAVDLAPGRYGFVCFLPDADGTHALKGMNSDLRVQ